MSTQTSEARELSLISTVELRFASASTNKQLQPLVTTYLAPLLLKLSSPHAAVREKTRDACHHIINRLTRDQEVDIPIRKLVEQFRQLDSEGVDGSSFNDDVRKLDLVLIDLGLSRIEFLDREKEGEILELLKLLLHVPASDVKEDGKGRKNDDNDDGLYWGGETDFGIRPRIQEQNMSLPTRLWLYGFRFLLNVIPSPFFPLPGHNTSQDRVLTSRLSLSSSGTAMLAKYLTKFLMVKAPTFFLIADSIPDSVAQIFSFDEETGILTPRYAMYPTRGLSGADRAMFCRWLARLERDRQLDRRAMDQRVAATKAAAAKLLFTSIFSDRQRFLPAVVMTADDTILTVFQTGDTMFKQCIFDLEDPSMVDDLFILYFGRRGPKEGELTLPAEAKIQIRILRLLAKSKIASTRTTQILRLLEEDFMGRAVYFDGQDARRQAAAFVLLDWIAHAGLSSDVSAIASKVSSVLQTYILSQGWPNPAVQPGRQIPTWGAELRAKAYEGIGTWATRVDQNWKAHKVGTMGAEVEELDRLRFLLSSLSCDHSSSDIQVSIDATLGKLLNVFPKSIAFTSEGKEKLRELLQRHMTNEIGTYDDEAKSHIVRSTKFAAVRYANRCLPFDDYAARWMDLLAVGEGKMRLRNELIEEGLRGLDLHWWSSMSRSSADSSYSEAFSLTLNDFSMLVDHFFGGENGEKLTRDPQGVYENALPEAISFCRSVLVLSTIRSANITIKMELEWEKNVDALLCNNFEARASFRECLERDIERPALLRFLRAVLTGMTLRPYSDRCANIAIGVCALLPNGVIGSVLPEANLIKHVALSNEHGAQLQAAKLLGIFLSHPDYSLSDRKEFIRAALTVLQNWRSAIGQEVNEVRGHLLSVASILSRQSLRGLALSDDQDAYQTLLDIAVAIILDSRDAALQSGGHIALGQVMLCFNGTEHIHAGLFHEQMIVTLRAQALKDCESAIIALGRLACGAKRIGTDGEGGNESPNPAAWAVIESLLSLHEIKRTEAHFAVGEALSVASAGWGSSATAIELDLDVARPSEQESFSIMEQTIDKVIADSKTTKPSLKKASSIWLLCLIQFSGQHRVVQQRLRQCQGAFAGLLTSRDEIVQETGSRGLSLVYEMGDENLKNDLVRELVASFTGGNARMGGTVMSDTELFEPGALPTGDGSVTTYKDIVSLASEMGDPGLVYRFMNLASNNAIWTSRAAFGRFGLSNILAGSDHLSKNKNFYPKLFRYRFDPNPNVQRSMNDIWKALVKDTNSVVDQHFDLIMEDLLKSLVNGKEWRIRQASCAAISELLQGRDIDKFEKHLNEIWTKAFKVLDDIKETVRSAAMGLCRTLTNLLIRNLEIGTGMSARAQKLLDYAMRFLLRQMEAGSAKEVQEYASKTLFKVIQKSPPKALRPYAPDIVEFLISSMSSLEPEAVNYIHMNADKYGVTAEKLDSIRVSGVSSSPAMRAVERCIEDLDNESMSEVMKRLSHAFKSVIGLPSKVALSSLLVTLTVRHTVDFRPYADQFVQLLRKHLFDRNETVVNSNCFTLAYLMRLSSDEEVAKTADFVKSLYFASEEISHRLIAGDIVRAFSKVANDKFMTFSTTLLPFAFIGRNDVDKQVGEPFQKTWEDNVGGGRAVSLYLAEIVGLAEEIDSPQWGVKHTISLAVADLIVSLDPVVPTEYSQQQATSIWPLLEKALAAKTWEGKEKVIDAFPKFVKKALSLRESKRDEFESISLREAKRNNTAYRPHAITALGKVVTILGSAELSSRTLNTLHSIVLEIINEPADMMDLDDKPASLDAERRRQTQ